MCSIESIGSNTPCINILIFCYRHIIGIFFCLTGSTAINSAIFSKNSMTCAACISLLRKANNVPNSYLLGTVLYTIYSNPRYELCSSLLGMLHQVEYFSLLGIVRPVHCTAPSLLVLSDIYSSLLCWKQYRRYSTAFCSIKNSMYGI
jgi:hypothetical protein